MTDRGVELDSLEQQLLRFAMEHDGEFRVPASSLREAISTGDACIAGKGHMSKGAALLEILEVKERLTGGSSSAEVQLAQKIAEAMLERVRNAGASSADGQRLYSVQMDRVRDCHVLSEAFGLDVEPYYQDPSKGPEQRILFYQIDLLKQGLVMDYSQVSEIMMRIPKGGSDELSLIGLDTRLCSGSQQKNGRHLAVALIIRKEVAHDQGFLNGVASPDFQRGLSQIRQHVRNPEVAKIAKDVDANLREKYRADKSYSFSDELANRLLPHL